MIKDLVSIVMPVHMKLNELNKQVIKSIINQTYEHVELCILLSGITKTELEEWSNFIKNQNSKDFNVHLIYKKRLFRPGEARKELINITYGEFILFADSDDILDYKIIEKKISISKAHNVNIVFSNAYTFKNLMFLEKKILGEKKYVFKLYLQSIFHNHLLGYMFNNFPNSGTLVRKNQDTIINLINYPLESHEDYIFYHNLIKSSFSFALTTEKLVGWNINNNTTTGNKFKSRIWHYRATKKLLPQEKNWKLILITFLGTIILYLIGIIENSLKFKNINYIIIFKKKKV